MPTKLSGPSKIKKKHQALVAIGLLAFILGVLFFRSFDPALVIFSNDGPLGNQVAAMNYAPANIWNGSWQDLNSIGTIGGTLSVDITILLLYALQLLLGHVIGSVAFAKVYAPIALLILGAGACFFFRQLKLSPLAVTLGTLAAVLNSTFFADACWGVASHEIALSMDFFALGLIVANTPETRPSVRLVRLALAGLCVGINVMEAADIGALYSLFIAAFVFYKAITDDGGTIVKKLVSGFSGVAVVTICAGFIALQTVLSLVGTQIQGVAGTGQDAKTKAARWDFATQWSEPKLETLGLVVPGLFGYKMDTPKDMMPAFKDFYQGGVYWGGMGRDPANDRFFDSGGQGTPPNPNWMRQTGGGDYCGILVALLAMWVVAQSLRRQNSPFTGVQKKFVWFWTAVLVGSTLLSWGRFAPFDYYRHTLYALPYFSTIRNPAKFIIFLSWAMVILFGYGVHVLSRRHLEVVAVKSSGLVGQLQYWWARTAKFDRNCVWAWAGIWSASVLGWFVYASKKSALMHYLQLRGFPDADFTRQIADFSVGQAGWWLVLFAAAIFLLTLVMAGYFAGARAKWGGLILGAFLILDLGRANLPYICHWNYQQKYEVGSLNPIESFLRDKPYEHRVAILPFDTRQSLRSYDNTFGGLGIYRIEWTQHHFLYYNIQSLDIIQMPRMPADLQSYLEALSPHTQAEVSHYTRLWELTNTRYLLGAAGFLDVLNEQLDPVQRRFRIAQRFDIIAKPGISQPTKLEELTAVSSSDGDLALFDFAGALPRAKLYSNWQVNTNDQAVLDTLAAPNFDPAKTVLVSTPQTSLPPLATNLNSGTVEFKSYAPKDLVFAAEASVPSVLLLNDKYDPHWSVQVDGKPAELLRCNYIMRGVYLAPGSHKVEFKFILPNGMLYVTLAAFVAAILLCAFLALTAHKRPAVVS